ncbi:MAG: ABC transporter permease subunit [Bdellovibrionota bacterium]
MGAILTIAKRDFKSAFASPKAAAIFFFFLMTMGLFFYNFVASLLEAQARAPMMGGQAPNLEELIRALFYNLHFTLILIIPAITMATFAEEKKNQSFRILQTAPITALQIVLGKFLAIAGIMAVVLVASSIYPLFLVKYGNPDSGVIYTSYLGIFLLICGQLAFGLWVSSMTKNQIMAFIFTMFGLFMLMVLNWLAPNLTGNDFFESMLKYIASTEHLDVFFKGLITIADIAYFVLFAGIFLFFTNIVIDSQRWR